MDGLTWDVYIWTSAGYQLLRLHAVNPQGEPPQLARLKMSDIV